VVTAFKHAGIFEHEVAEVVGHDHPRITYGALLIEGGLTASKLLLRPSGTTIDFKRKLSNYLPIPPEYDNSLFSETQWGRDDER